MTRVLHIITGLDIGGAEVFLANIAPRLLERGIEQKVVSLRGNGPISMRLTETGIDVVPMEVSGLLSAIRATHVLARLIRAYRPDVVQGWMYHGDLLSTLASMLSRDTRHRLIWNIRCSDMRLSDYSIKLKLVIKACSILSLRPDVVLANSEAGLLIHSKIGYRPRESRLISNGIDTHRFKPDERLREEVRQELKLARDDFVVFHVARLDPMKDHAAAISAVSQLDGMKVIFVGKGTERLSLPSNAKALGPRHDVARLLCAGDCIFSSSAYGEGFSNALAEGMSAGLVPVATRVGDSERIVGDVGHVVAAGDIIAMRLALESLRNEQFEVRVAHRRRARQRVVGEFSLESAVQAFTHLYRHAG